MSQAGVTVTVLREIEGFIYFKLLVFGRIDWYLTLYIYVRKLFK